MTQFILNHTFRFIIIFTTIVMAFGVIFFIRKKYESLVSNEIRPDRGYHYNDAVFLFLFIIFAALYIAAIPVWEDFTYQDNIIFFGTLKDGEQWYHPPVWLQAGRFFPLAHQEFFFISKISPTNFAYHFFSICELLVLIFIIVKMIGFRIGLLVSLTLMVSPPVVQSFFGLIYPERNMIVLLALVILTFINTVDKCNIQSISFLSLFTCAFLFYKETSFLIIFGLSASALIYFVVSKNKNAIPAASLFFFSAFLWISCYLVFIYPNIVDAYGNVHRSIIETFAKLIASPWAILSVVSMVVWSANSRKPSPLIMMPVISIGYSFTMYWLRFDMPYYHAPACVLSLLSLAILNKNQKVLVITSCVIVILFTAKESIDVVEQRKEIVHAKSDAVSYIYKTSLTNGLDEINLSFKNSSPYESMLFSGYIKNKYNINVLSSENYGCNGKVNFIVSFYYSNAVHGKYTYKSEDIGKWNNKYHVYVTNCMK